MKRMFIPWVVLALVIVGAVPVVADQVATKLQGYMEVPAISSTGIGVLRATIDDVLQQVAYELSYANLEGTASGAHIHLGQRSVSGGILAFLCGGGGKPACPPAGMVTGTITPADIMAVPSQGIAAGEWDEFVAALRAGVTYANVHTDKHPSGEIRGQIIRITPTP
jgi:hypothetical protein